MSLNFYLSPESHGALMFGQGKNKYNSESIARKDTPFERCLKLTGVGPHRWYTTNYTFYVLFIEGALYLIIRRPLQKQLPTPFISSTVPSEISVKYVDFDFYLLGEGEPKEIKPFSWANHLSLLKVKQKASLSVFNKYSYEYTFLVNSKYVSEIKDRDSFNKFINFYLKRQSLKEIVGI